MSRALDDAIRAARGEDYLRALTLFLDVYGSDQAARLKTPKGAGGLSYFGLSLALVKRQFKPAIDLCRRAIEIEFYNGEHYANLARVYVAAGNRRKALEAIEEGLRHVPEDDSLISVRQELGVRSRPAVPFLDRTNPINVSLGQARHAKKISEKEKKKRGSE
jgi:tetratricopeptide (TPR) repeat protein